MVERKWAGSKSPLPVNASTEEETPRVSQPVQEVLLWPVRSTIEQNTLALLQGTGTAKPPQPTEA
jgi:hypothetical protein